MLSIEVMMSLDALLEQKNSPSSEVRIQVAQQLGEMHLPEAYTPLVEMLHDQVPQVRRAAVRALGNLGDLRAIETLVELFEDEEFWESSDWVVR